MKIKIKRKTQSKRTKKAEKGTRNRELFLLFTPNGLQWNVLKFIIILYFMDTRCPV